MVRVTVCDALVPVVTLPKLREAGDAASVRVGATPEPASGTENEGVGELFERTRLPAKVPADAGLKLTLKE